MKAFYNNFDLIAVSFQIKVQGEASLKWAGTGI